MDETSSSGDGSAAGRASPTDRERPANGGHTIKRRRLGLPREDFQRVFQQGLRSGSSLCRVAAFPGEGRMGYAAGKKAGTIARRNRLKRRLRAAVRECGEHVDPRLDYIVLAGGEAVDAPFVNIVTAIEAALRDLRTRWESEWECS